MQIKIKYNNLGSGLYRLAGWRELGSFASYFFFTSEEDEGGATQVEWLMAVEGGRQWTSPEGYRRR